MSSTESAAAKKKKRNKKKAAKSTSASTESKAQTSAAATPAQSADTRVPVSRYTPPDNFSVPAAAELENVTVKHGDSQLAFKKRKFTSGSLPGKLGDIAAQTDLRVGTYEGGLKLWEVRTTTVVCVDLLSALPTQCALDLIAFLAEQHANLKGVSVCELGCGHGLPGIYCL